MVSTVSPQLNPLEHTYTHTHTHIRQVPAESYTECIKHTKVEAMAPNSCQMTSVIMFCSDTSSCEGAELHRYTIAVPPQFDFKPGYAFDVKPSSSLDLVLVL